MIFFPNKNFSYFEDNEISQTRNPFDLIRSKIAFTKPKFCFKNIKRLKPTQKMAARLGKSCENTSKNSRNQLTFNSL